MIPPGAGTAVAPGEAAALCKALESWLGNAPGKTFIEPVQRHGQMRTWTRFSAAVMEMLRV
jgi:hypothetical protein